MPLTLSDAQLLEMRHLVDDLARRFPSNPLVVLVAAECVSASRRAFTPDGDQRRIVNVLSMIRCGAEARRVDRVPACPLRDSPALKVLVDVGWVVRNAAGCALADVAWEWSRGRYVADGGADEVDLPAETP